MMSVFRKCLLVISLGLTATNYAIAESEHQNSQCKQLLMTQLQSGNATPQKECKLTNKLIMWLALQEGEGSYSFAEITNFIKENPGWPNQSTLKRRAEQAIDSSVKDKTIIQWLSHNPPRTTDGTLAYLHALHNTGQIQTLKPLAKKAWVEKDFSESRQKDFLSSFGTYISASDDTQRLERLLWSDQKDQVKRLMPRLSADQQKMAQARLKFKAKEKSGVPSKYQAHEGVLFDQVKSLRRQKRFAEAAQLILTSSISPNRASHWWGEINYIARELMESRRFKDAEKLMSKHKLTSGEHFAVAEWTLGWMNLRFLNNPKKAAQHFERLYQNVGSPLSVSRAAYWAGRAYEAQGKTQEAANWYQKAANLRTTFYGQLSAAKLQYTPHPVLSTYQANDQTKSRLLKKELVQALKLLSQAGKPAYQWTRPFALKLASQTEDKHEKHTLLDLVASWTPHETVWFARKTGNKKQLEVTQAFPHLPKTSKPMESPEMALSHAIAYQESRFDAHAVSHAGAMGLMQLMPATAKFVAQKEGIPHSKSKLTTDPEHNVILGSHNLAHLLDYYDGSYVLAIAAYNAGEAPVNRWIEVFGDPRKDEVDIIDWIELIPYHETRNYVQRVLENLGPYRIVLEGQAKDTIIQDLQR